MIGLPSKTVGFAFQTIEFVGPVLSVANFTFTQQTYKKAAYGFTVSKKHKRQFEQALEGHRAIGLNLFVSQGSHYWL